MTGTEAGSSSFSPGKQPTGFSGTTHWSVPSQFYLRRVVRAAHYCCAWKLQFEGLTAHPLWLSDVSSGDRIGILMLQLTKGMNSSFLRHGEMLVILLLGRYQQLLIPQNVSASTWVVRREWNIPYTGRVPPSELNAQSLSQQQPELHLQSKKVR